METFRLCRELVDGVTMVDNAAISAAIKDVFNETRSILEPAGAVAVAGAKAWLKRHGHKGKKVRGRGLAGGLGLGLAGGLDGGWMGLGSVGAGHGLRLGSGRRCDARSSPMQQPCTPAAASGRC
jgi:hypothetical protein